MQIEISLTELKELTTMAMIKKVNGEEIAEEIDTFLQRAWDKINKK